MRAQGGIASAAAPGSPEPSPVSPTRRGEAASRYGGQQAMGSTDGVTGISSPKGAMAAAKQRLQDVPSIVLPPIPAVRLGVTDEKGRVTRLPIFGSKDINSNDVTYRSDAIRESQSEVFHAPLELQQKPKQQQVEDWRQLAIKIPYSATHDLESYSCQSLDQDVVEFFVSHEGNYITEAPGEHLTMDIHINEKPSSRRQAQLLSAWFSKFLDGMTGNQSPPARRHGEKLAPLRTSAGDMSSAKELSQTNPNPANPAVVKSDFDLPEFYPPVLEGLDPELESNLHSHMVKREKTLQQLQFLKATGLLQVTREHSNWCSTIQAIGVCYAFLAQQVGVHCYERGALMTQVWNIYSEMMDMKFADMRQAVLVAESLRKQNEALKKNANDAQRELTEAKIAQASLIQKLKAQVVELSSSISGAQSERDAIASENLVLEGEINDLLMSIQPLRDTISEKARTISDLEYSRDLLLSAMQGMASGHLNMQGMLPTLETAASDTIAAVNSAVRALDDEIELQNIMRDGELSATTVKVVSSQIGSELKRVMEMSALVDKKIEEEEEAAAQEQARRIEAEANEKMSKPPPSRAGKRGGSAPSAETATVETQTPEEWAQRGEKLPTTEPADASGPRNISFATSVQGGDESGNAAEHAEEAPSTMGSRDVPSTPSREGEAFCPQCDRKMNMICKSCFRSKEWKDALASTSAADSSKDKALREARAMQEEMEEALADMKAHVKELKKGNASLRQEISKLQDQLLKAGKKSANAPGPSSRAAAGGTVDASESTPSPRPDQAQRASSPKEAVEPQLPAGVSPSDDSVLAKLYDEVQRLTSELEAARAKMHSRAAEVKFNLPPSDKELAETPKAKPKSARLIKGRGKSARKLPNSNTNQKLAVKVDSSPSRDSSTRSLADVWPAKRSQSGALTPVSPGVGQRGTRGNAPQAPLVKSDTARSDTFKSIRSIRSLHTPQSPVPPTELRGNYKNANLLEALDRYRNAKPRTPEWLLSFIEKVYKGKHMQDTIKSRDGQELSGLVDYMFQHLQGTYGTRLLVLEYVSQILVTLNTYLKKDTRFQVFNSFLTEEWDTGTLEVFLHSRIILSEPSGMRCLEFPADYVEKRGASPWLCTRKAMAVADMLLMQRSKEAMAGFREIVVSRAMEATEDEKQRFFSSSDGGDMEAHMKEEERINGPFRKMPTVVFQQALCREFYRCEQILGEAAGTLFKKYDYNSNGMQEYHELCDIVKQLQSELGEEYAEEDATALWNKAASIQLKGDIGKGGAVRPLTEVQTIGMTAFREAAAAVPIIRRYVRLFMTPPPRDADQDGGTISLQRVIGMVVTRQWRLFGNDIDDLLPQTHANMLTLQSLIGTLKRENDGPTRCGLYCRILKVMCEAKLEDLQMQCSEEALMKNYDETLEQNLTRMALALKVFYGRNCLMDDDFPDDRELGKNDVRSTVERLELFNAVRFKAQTFAVKMIQRRFRSRHSQGNKLGTYMHKASTDVTALVKAEHMSHVTPTEGYEVMDLDDEPSSEDPSRTPSTQGIEPNEFTAEGN